MRSCRRVCEDVSGPTVRRTDQCSGEQTAELRSSHQEQVTPSTDRNRLVLLFRPNGLWSDQAFRRHAGLKHKYGVILTHARAVERSPKIPLQVGALCIGISRGMSGTPLRLTLSCNACFEKRCLVCVGGGCGGSADICRLHAGDDERVTLEARRADLNGRSAKHRGQRHFRLQCR